MTMMQMDLFAFAMTQATVQKNETPKTVLMRKNFHFNGNFQAYDMAWAYRPGSKWTGQHQMSINGKRDGFRTEDFIAAAKHFDISKPQEIINTVCETALAFGDFAMEAGVPDSIVRQMQAEFRTYLKK